MALGSGVRPSSHELIGDGVPETPPVPASDVDYVDPPEENDEETYADPVNDLLTLPVEEFARMKVAERDAALFLLLQSLVGEVRALTFRVDEFEEKARNLADPEKIKEMAGAFLEATPFGGMLGGLG